MRWNVYQILISTLSWKSGAAARAYSAKRNKVGRNARSYRADGRAMQMYRGALRIRATEPRINGLLRRLNSGIFVAVVSQRRNEISYAIWLNWIFREPTRLKKDEYVGELSRCAKALSGIAEKICGAKSYRRTDSWMRFPGLIIQQISHLLIEYIKTCYMHVCVYNARFCFRKISFLICSDITGVAIWIQLRFESNTLENTFGTIFSAHLRIKLKIKFCIGI